MTARKAAKKAVRAVRQDPSSFEFQQLAEANLDAANTCYSDCQRRDQEFNNGNREAQATSQVIPAVFLYFRAIELALKAAIRERNLATTNQIRSRALGHSLAALIERVTVGTGAFTLAELGMDQTARDFLERWSEDYGGKSFEYHFGPWDIPDPAQCQQIATSIVEAVSPSARTLPATLLP
jgi:hypothetical protein